MQSPCNAQKIVVKNAHFSSNKSQLLPEISFGHHRQKCKKNGNSFWNQKHCWHFYGRKQKLSWTKKREVTRKVWIPKGRIRQICSTLREGFDRKSFDFSLNVSCDAWSGSVVGAQFRIGIRCDWTWKHSAKYFSCTQESENAQPYQHLRLSNSRNKSGKHPTTKETGPKWCISQPLSCNMPSGQQDVPAEEAGRSTSGTKCTKNFFRKASRLCNLFWHFFTQKEEENFDELILFFSLYSLPLW